MQCLIYIFHFTPPHVLRSQPLHSRLGAEEERAHVPPHFGSWFLNVRHKKAAEQRHLHNHSPYQEVSLQFEAQTISSCGSTGCVVCWSQTGELSCNFIPQQRGQSESSPVEDKGTLQNRPTRNKPNIHNSKPQFFLSNKRRELLAKSTQPQKYQTFTNSQMLIAYFFAIIKQLLFKQNFLKMRIWFLFKINNSQKYKNLMKFRLRVYLILVKNLTLW